jgi:hypothetical protein
MESGMSEIMDDDSILNYVQSQRLALVKEMTKTQMPAETAERNVMLTALRDMSHDVLVKKKIGSDAQASKDQTRGLVAAILNAVTPSTGRVLSDVTDVSSQDLPAVRLDDRVSLPTLLPDETHQGEISDTYEAFQKRYNAGLRVDE